MTSYKVIIFCEWLCFPLTIYIIPHWKRFVKAFLKIFSKKETKNFVCFLCIMTKPVQSGIVRGADFIHSGRRLHPFGAQTSSIRGADFIHSGRKLHPFGAQTSSIRGADFIHSGRRLLVCARAHHDSGRIKSIKTCAPRTQIPMRPERRFPCAPNADSHAPRTQIPMRPESSVKKNAPRQGFPCRAPRSFSLCV